MSTPPLKKLLFIDDDTDILTILKFCFTDRTDLTILCASSGPAGIELATKELPDLILLDVMMPGMDGIATLQTIRLIPALRTTPIIFLTAKAQKHEIDQFLQMDIADIIVKPFDPIALPKIIDACWEKYQSKKASL